MHSSPIMEIMGIQFDLSIIIMMTVTCIIVFALARVCVSNLSVANPSKMQNFLEWVVEFVQGIVASTMDLKKGRVFLSLGLTLIMFIFIANFLGLPFAIVTEHHEPMESIGVTADSIKENLDKTGHHPEVVWWKSPTADASVTLGLAFLVIVIVHGNALLKNPKYYFKHYFEPFPVFFPLNIIKQIAKPVTLGLRLFGNIFAGEIFIAKLITAGVFGIIPLIAWQAFSIFVGAIQAFIFVVLSMVYISMEIKQDDHH